MHQNTDVCHFPGFHLQKGDLESDRCTCSLQIHRMIKSLAFNFSLDSVHKEDRHFPRQKHSVADTDCREGRGGYRDLSEEE